MTRPRQLDPRTHTTQTRRSPMAIRAELRFHRSGHSHTHALQLRQCRMRCLCLFVWCQICEAIMQRIGRGVSGAGAMTSAIRCGRVECGGQRVCANGTIDVLGPELIRTGQLHQCRHRCHQTSLDAHFPPRQRPGIGLKCKGAKKVDRQTARSGVFVDSIDSSADYPMSEVCIRSNWRVQKVFVRFLLANFESVP